MTRCPEQTRLQALLDGDLGEAEAERVRGHLAGCPECARAQERYERLFAALCVPPVRDPGPALTERVLDRVVPSRVRRRAVTVVGWSYAVASGVTTFAFLAWITRPSTLDALGRLLVTASHRLVEAGVFTVRAASLAWLGLVEGWGLLAVTGAWVAPLTRALGLLFGNPVFSTALWAAVVTCAIVLWWMLPRPVRVRGGNRHVGILAF